MTSRHFRENFFNSEGYEDPTCYEALRNLERQAWERRCREAVHRRNRIEAERLKQTVHRVSVWRGRK